MSATNRRANLKPLDLYETPDWLTLALIPHLRKYNPRGILEPAVGGGAIARILKREFPEANITVGDVTTGQDFRVHDYGGPFDLIMTNPPYSLAMEFIQRALPLDAQGGTVALLLRVNFMGGQERASFRRKCGSKLSLYISPRRPDFTGEGGDATEYAWFVWDDNPRRIEWLPTENEKKRETKTFSMFNDGNKSTEAPELQ
jgi:hypothetical protein